MNRTVYLNGVYLPEQDAKVSIFDRGYVFGDGVYEVVAVLEGKLVDSARHKWRLEKSLHEIQIAPPLSWGEIETMERKLIELNQIDQGLVYFQITRGVADRAFSYNPDLLPTISAFTQRKKLDPDPLAETGVRVITCADLRWKRRDIKSISLLGQVMAKQTAHERDAFEAVMIEDGYVTEGASSSIFIIDNQDTLIARPGGGNDILPGLTRQAMIEVAQQNNINIINRCFTCDELYQAKECFLTSASTFVLPIVKADDVTIADGHPGPLTMKLRKRLLEMMRAGLS